MAGLRRRSGWTPGRLRTRKDDPGRDDEVDRLFALVARYFRRGIEDLSVLDRMGVDRPELFEYYVAARQLERVADHAEKLATIAGETDEPVDGALAEPARKAGAIVADAMAALLNGSDPEAAYSALRDRDALIRDLRALDRAYYERDDESGYRLSVVVDSLVRTVEYGGNIAEAALGTTPRTRTQ